MSQLRENSKSGFGRHKDETHVLSPPEPVPSTTSTTIISTTSLSSVSSVSAGQDGTCINSNRKNNSGSSRSSADIHSDMEISIQIPRPTQTSRGEGNESERGCSSSKNSVSVCVEGDDNDHDEENENDSDPPVENYNLFRLDFQGQEDREDDRYPDDGLMSIVSPMGPMTIEEQRQHQKIKAQSQHRKRKKSANSSNNVDGNYIPPYRKRFRRSVLPSKFLLGGNIRDPLNLASLADAKVNAALNAETPKSSPVPIPLYRHGEVPVFIPKNPDDPLGLKSEAENPYDFIAGIRKNSKARKHRHRKKGGRKRTNSECSVDKSEDSDGNGKDTKDKDSSVSSEEEKTKSVVEKSSKPIKSSKSEPSVFAVPSSVGGSVKVKEAEITIPEKQDQVEKINKKIESSEPVIPVKAESCEVPLSKEKKPIVKDNDSGEIDATAGPSSKLPISTASTVAEAPATASKSIQTVSGGQGQVAGAPSTSKKKSRHRRRVRKYGGRPGGQFVPTGYFLSAKTSDYVPLGTPSVHEPNYWYSNYTPNYTPNSGGHDRYQYDVHSLPFESPSLENYFSSLETPEPGSAGVKSPVANVMEPFSPPPKQEAKRRRIELATGTEPAASITATTTRTSIDTAATTTTTTSTSSSSSNKKPEPVQPQKIKPSGVQTSASEKTVKADSANFLRPNPPSRLLTRANFRRRFRHKADPIVSPVIPQPGCRRRFSHYGHGHHNNHSNCNYHGHHGHKKPSSSFNVENNIAPVGGRRSQNLSITPASEGSGRTSGNSKSKPEPVPRFRKKDEMFQYGNYNRYYGYRGSTDGGNDLRLKAFPKEFFYGKDILDVGCNIGHVTLTIARDFGAKVVTGMDIDSKLIQVAKKNIKHYVDRDPADETIRFPHSCPTLYGVLQPPPGTLGDTRKIPFPYNVSFKHENYVLESDEMLETVKPEYDIILCLSISKWIHLNYGDDGLKRFFRRVYRHLRPGGKLVLEPQPWSSYRKKKSLTERIYTTYKSIKLFPDKFHDYLLGEVGFSTLEKLQTPAHHSKGFQRPLMIFTKANNDITANTVHDGSSAPATDLGAQLDKDMSGGVGMDVVPHPSSEQPEQNLVSVTAETSEAVAATSSSLFNTEGDSDSCVGIPVSSSTITSSTLKPHSDPDDSETCAITNTNESSSAGMPLPSSSS